jgi:hypothetical protein
MSGNAFADVPNEVLYAYAPYAGVASVSYDTPYPDPEKWSYDLSREIEGGVSASSNVLGELPDHYFNGILYDGRSEDYAAANMSFSPWTQTPAGVTTIAGTYRFEARHDSGLHLQNGIYRYQGNNNSNSYGQYWLDAEKLWDVAHGGARYGFINIRYNINLSCVPDPLIAPTSSLRAGAAIWLEPDTISGRLGSSEEEYVYAVGAFGATTATATGTISHPFGYPSFARNTDLGVGIRFSSGAYSADPSTPIYKQLSASATFDVEIVAAPSQELLAQEILKNSVSVQVDGGRIRAQFTPKFGLSLQEAAEQCGVVGFNWVQTVVPPASWTSWTADLQGGLVPVIGVDAVGTPFTANYDVFPPELTPLDSQPLPLTDPILNGNAHSYFFVVKDFDGHYQRILTPQRGADGAPYYLNLFEDAPGRRLTLDEFTTDRTLFFEDVPTLGEGYLLDGESVAFRTSLVGMKADGTYIVWNDLGTNINWQTNRTHLLINGVDAFYFDAREADVPPSVSGGIFDVRLDTSVPEPTSVAQLIGALILCLAAPQRARSRTQAMASSRRSAS